MASEVDKLLEMLKDFDSNLDRIESKAKRVISSNKVQIERYQKALSIYESEIQLRDAYIRKLEDAIQQYKRATRFW